MKSLKIEVNQNRLIQNIGSVFSDSTKVLCELLQNGRRAGATRIDVVQGDGFISVSDNGSGIKSFKDLLTLAQSNWDEAVVEEDAPYGMGFFATLFAAEKVLVQSQGKQIEIITAGNLLDQEINVLDSTVTVGTVVTLYGESTNKLKVHNDLISRCKGFPVDVYFSGQYDYEKREIAQNLLIPSDHRQGSGFEPFECGFISYDLSKLKGSGSFCGLNYIAYLQGFPILGRDHFGNRIVVHLNNTFKARMPDRDCLINENDQRDIITQAVYAFLRNKLLELKAIDKREVLSYHALASAIGCLDIFNDIDELPVDFFCTLQSVHKEYQHYDMERSYLTMTEAGTEFFSREYLSKQLIVSDIADGDNGDDDFSMALNMALMQSEALIMACSLDPEHWIQTIVLDSPSMAHHKDEPTDGPTKPPVSVEYTPLKATVWYGITVYLVDQYTINVPSLGLSVVVDGDHGLALGGDENAYRPDGTVAQDIFLLPPRAGSGVLTQVRDWYWDNSYHDDAAEEDKQSLQGVIDLLRGTNESDVLKVLLGRTDFSVRKALTGQTFQVTFFEDGHLEVRAAA